MRSGEITALLKQAVEGDAVAEERLLQFLYGELRRMAARHLRRERPGHTLQPTELLNEVFVRVMRGEKPQRWNDRSHFFAVASTAMRRILVDHARRRSTAKRGSGVTPDDIADAAMASLTVPSASSRSIQRSPRWPRSTRDRLASSSSGFFVGMLDEEIAAILGVSLQ